jgi:1-acyl-sn-glycerol-3-phosphate acyltransferase
MLGGWLYSLIRPFARVAIALYFRKIHLRGLEKLPARGPLILACNHPNSFTEACILATFQPRTLHFLVRGDVFRNPIVAYLLRQTNQIPIYRFKDGFSGLKQNESTFAACYRKLKEGAAILIFSEASSIFEKRLRPIQKGTARLAFGAWEQHGPMEDFHILPVGVNYAHGDRFRSEVCVELGEPIRLADYAGAYAEQPKRAVEQLTSKIADSLNELVIQVRDKSRDQLFDDCMDLVDSADPVSPLRPLTHAPDRFAWEKKLAARINSMEEEEAEALKGEVQSLRRSLPKNVRHLSDLRYLDAAPWPTRLLSWSLLPLGLPGIVYFVAPYYLARLIAIPFLRYREFYTGVRIGAMLVLGMLQGLSLLLISLLMKWYILTAFVLLVPLWGWLAVQFLEAQRAAVMARRLTPARMRGDAKRHWQQILSRLKD